MTNYEQWQINMGYAEIFQEDVIPLENDIDFISERQIELISFYREIESN